MKLSADTFLRRKGTIIFSIFLIVWFFTEIYLAQILTKHQFEWILFTKSKPSLGWILSSITHSGYSHLFNNLLVLLFFGWVAEPILGSRNLISMIVGLSIAGNTAHFLVSGTGDPVAGTSAGLFALESFYTWYFFHYGIHEIDIWESDFVSRLDSLYKPVVGAFGIIYPIFQTLSDLNMVSIGMSGGAEDPAILGHIIGFILGIWFFYIVSHRYFRLNR